MFFVSPNSPQIYNFSLCFIFLDVSFPHFIYEYPVEDDEENSSESEENYKSQSWVGNHFLLCAHEAVNKEVDGAINNEEEVLDGSEAEHPGGMGWEHPQVPAQVCPLDWSK